MDIVRGLLDSRAEGGKALTRDNLTPFLPMKKATLRLHALSMLLDSNTFVDALRVSDGATPLLLPGFELYARCWNILLTLISPAQRLEPHHSQTQA